jgi:hypothetical protein
MLTLLVHFQGSESGMISSFLNSRFVALLLL